MLYKALKPEPQLETCARCGEGSEELTTIGNYDQESEPYCSTCFMDEFHGTKFNHELNDRYDD